jgi:hypothetical protein
MERSKVMKKLWTLVLGMFLLVFFLTVLSSNFQVKIEKQKNQPQLACTPPIKPPPVPKTN